MPRLASFFVGLTLLLVSSRAAVACPLCKEAMSRDGQHQEQSELGEGISRSILLMIGVPTGLLVVGTIAVFRVASRGGIPEL
jgi:hypothetical protein